MASEKAIAVNYDREHKEILQNMGEEGKRISISSGKFNANLLAQGQLTSVVSITNTTTGLIQLQSAQTQNWAGNFIGTIPSAIANNSTPVSFYQAANAINGSQGGVVYQGAGYGMLVAWISPVDPSPNNPNRVYVRCGGLDKLPPKVDWSVIRPLIVGPTSSDFDPVTKTSISATVAPQGNTNYINVAFAATP